MIPFLITLVTIEFVVIIALIVGNGESEDEDPNETADWLNSAANRICGVSVWGEKELSKMES